MKEIRPILYGVADYAAIAAAFAVAASALFSVAAYADETAKRPMALVIMTDGLRADTVESGRMPNLERLRAGKWMPGYKSAWTLTGQVSPGSIPSSAPNHVSIATGYGVPTHGLTSNAQLEAGAFTAKPTWLKRIADARPGATALFVFSWWPDANLYPAEGVEFMKSPTNEDDAPNASALSLRLAGADAPDVTLWFIDAPDVAGHAHNFYPMSSPYLAAAETTDRYIGMALDAIASRPTFAEEDWLVAVVSDHGGYANQHGVVQSGNMASHSVPIVICGTGMTQGRIPGVPYNYCVAANVLGHFGVTVPDLEATPSDGAPEPLARTLNDGLAVYLPFDGGTAANVAPGSGVTPEPSTGTAPAFSDNGMCGKYMNLPSGAYLKLTGTDTGSLAYEDSGRSFTAIVWTRHNGQTADTDPVLFGNKNWALGSNAGVAFLARMKRTFVVSGSNRDYEGAGFNAGDGANRLDIGPFDNEGSSAWTFYAVRRTDDGVITVYQGRSNGILGWTCGTFDGFTLASGLPFCIGQDGTGGYSKQFVGGVDDFALWTRGLSHDDIRRIYECGRAGSPLGDLLAIDANDAPKMDVASPSDGVYEISFGGRRSGTHALSIAYGTADAGEDKYAWDSFEKIADIPAATASYTYNVPETLKASNARFRFFLMQTNSLPYVKEVEYAHSDGTAYFNSGIAPRRELIAEFDIRLTADNTEWGTGKTEEQTAIYENMFGAFCGTDKLGNYGMCRFHKVGDSNHNKWDREYNSGKGYQFVGNCVPDTDYHVVFSTTNLFVNGTAYNSGITSANFIEGGYGIALYRNEKNGAIYDDTMIGYYKRFALYTPKRKVRGYVPVVDAGGTVGMFDSVTGQFTASVGTAFTAGADQDVARYGWVRCVSEPHLASATIPFTATYTGAGTDPLDFTDGANWNCTNAFGFALSADTIPAIDTDVTVSGMTAFQAVKGRTMFVCKSLKFDNATLPDNADIRGLDFSKVTSDSVIDLQGRMLLLADETSAAFASFTIKDTSLGAPGTVRVSPASGTLSNSSVALTGNLRLQKEGAGIFVPAKASQTYTGGTDVSNGTIRVNATVSGHFGTGAVTVLMNAVFDVYGKDATSATMVLAGGTLKNSANAVAYLPKVLSLAADSTILYAGSNNSNDMYAPKNCEWNLGGKTLSIAMTGNDSDFNFIQGGNNVVSNGTITVTVATGSGKKGFFAIRDLKGRDGLKLDIGNTYMRLQDSNNDSTVEDFTANPPSDSDVYSRNKLLQIYGRFMPKTATGFNMTMMDGSTLDLSQRTGAYDCAFPDNTYKANSSEPCTLQFASTDEDGNGTVDVKVALGDRTKEELKTIISGDGLIVKWSSEPAANVEFSLDDATLARGYRIKRVTGGLKLLRPNGLTIIVR